MRSRLRWGRCSLVTDRSCNASAGSHRWVKGMLFISAFVVTAIGRFVYDHRKRAKFGAEL
jgi:hypothetical protein